MYIQYLKEEKQLIFILSLNYEKFFFFILFNMTEKEYYPFFLSKNQYFHKKLYLRPKYV